jgi:HAD superfamily hydrolase (TIGR01549 family)
LHELFSRLRAHGIKIGIFSDYPAEQKLAALELHADAIACATDSHINRFKPHPAGFTYLLGQLKVSASECLHIGDREDRDAICAQRSGCASLILPAHHARTAGPAASYDRLFPTKPA